MRFKSFYVARAKQDNRMTNAVILQYSIAYAN